MCTVLVQQTSLATEFWQGLLSMTLKFEIKYALEFKARDNHFLQKLTSA